MSASTREPGDVEAVARALCAHAIRERRQWDTPAEEVEAWIAKGDVVNWGWVGFSGAATAAISALEAKKPPTAFGAVLLMQHWGDLIRKGANRFQIEAAERAACDAIYALAALENSKADLADANTKKPTP